MGGRFHHYLALHVEKSLHHYVVVANVCPRVV